MKKITVMIVMCLLFGLFTNAVFADRLHGFHENWRIEGSAYRSSGYNWTAKCKIPSGNMYIESKAQSPNQGVTQYYCVTPSTISYMTSRILVNQILTVRRNVSMEATSGHTYVTFAQKWDTSLTTTLTYGQTFIKSTNNQ